MTEVDALPTQLASDIRVELKPSTCFDGAEGVSEHPQRCHFHTQDVECRLVLVADYAKVVEANVVTIFRIIVPVHQR